MIQIKQHLTKEERTDLELLLSEFIDKYSDFYITKENLRLYIKENTDLLFECLKKGDKIIYKEGAVVLLTGWSDKAPRKYLKVIANDFKALEDILKVVNWNIKIDIWAKLKKNNPTIKILQKNGFQFKGDRGKELLLIRRGEK